MRILFVENHSVFANVVCGEFLGRHSVEVVPTLALARAKLRTHPFDLVLIDYDLDDGKGDELVQEVKLHFPSIKTIAVSSHKPGNDALRRAGADFVCPKMDFDRIQTVINQAERID
jgi:DNA-binding NtrC family response regulator